MTQATFRVEFDRITKRYPGVRALDEVSFGVLPGCIHAVVGENGAGKSTLMKVLSGATKAYGGTLRLEGREVAFRSASQGLHSGIAVVYQEFNLAPDLSVGENVFLGRWPKRLGFIDRGRIRAECESLFASIGLALPVTRPVSALSVAQQQMVEIARALSLRSGVLVLDEPSAVLTPREMESLFRLIRELAGRGVSVLYISHRLDEVFALADFVTVLRDGRHVSTRRISEADRDMVIREMVGRCIEEEFPSRGDLRGETLLQVEGFCSRGRFEEVGFEVRAGEVFAITGLIGSGRSSLGRAIFGACPATGRLRVGHDWGPFWSPRAAMRAGIAYLPEDRKRQGLLLHRSVRENLTLAHLADVSKAGVLRRSAELAATVRGILELRIRPALTEVAARTLSGGNQQKVLTARWFQRPYRVIILDEPTRGVDVGAKAELYGLINRMVAGGACVILITSEFAEAIGMADRIAVMARGRLRGILDCRGGAAVSQEMILQMAVGAG